MKRIRLSRPHPAFLHPQQPPSFLPQPTPLAVCIAPRHRRHASSVSQRPDSKHVMFPGAVKSAFSNTMRFEQPSSYPALPTYRVVDQSGAVVDTSFTADLSDEAVVKLYRDMLTVSIMDVIMFDAQRQGRLSFYMVSAGEEAVSVATASALAKDDVIFSQYREQGVFKQRGFTLNDFMDQLFANQKDPGKGRNMPVHYGSRELNIVRGCCGRPHQSNDHADLFYYSIPSRRLLRRSSRRPRALRMRSRSSGCRTPAYLRGWWRLTLGRGRPVRVTSTPP